MNHPNELSNVEKIKQLVDYLNLQRNAYYNENSRISVMRNMTESSMN